MQYIGLGTGSDGAATPSGTDAPIDSTAAGTATTDTLTATNASFAAGQLILIHQTRGSNAGVWEINVIESYVAGTITTVYPLANTYATSGANAAQVLVVEQNTNVTISGTMTAKAWDGSVGGILAYIATGSIVVTGSCVVEGKGFRGGAGVNNSGTTGQAWCGEGTSGASAQQFAANGNGGGGGKGDDAQGGGGGHVAGGETGNGGTVAGVGGGTAGSADLVTMVFGGGGGGSSDFQNETAFDGGDGGGIVILMARSITTSAGAINIDGMDGDGFGASGGTASGSGAGGSAFLKAKKITIGTNTITATGGARIPGASSRYGGAGSNGRVRLEGCDITGSTSSPAQSEVEGGFSFCSNASILGVVE